MKTIKVNRGQVLQRPGDLNSKFYEVKSGLLRSYTIDDKGKEHIFMFASEDWIMADNVGPNTPAEMFIDALEDSELNQREKTEKVEPENEKLIRRIAVLQKRVIMLMSASGIERYEHFVKTYPNIVQRVPQKMIASYLGITPEALSTVKKQRLSEK
ncbi:MAG: Crp/Fnr family transcriptional regulator [Fluviicola sp.]|nr:MAG: Crp/Fnr family transcriptional regulator [Fluviicola sp.]